jgi:hypothetical protein
VDEEGEDVYAHVGGDPFLDVRDDVLGVIYGLGMENEVGEGELYLPHVI